MDPSIIGEFKEAVGMSQQENAQRMETVEKLFDVVKTMMSNKQESKKTQTDQACMNNAMMYEYESNGSETVNPENLDDETCDPQDAKLKKLMEEKGINVEESDDEDENGRSLNEENCDAVHELDNDKSKSIINKSMLLPKEGSMLSLKNS